MLDIYLSCVVFLVYISAANSVICTDYTRHGTITFLCEEACCGEQYHRYCCKNTDDSETVRLVTLVVCGFMLLVSVVVVIICALSKSRGFDEQINQRNTAVQQDTNGVFSIPDATDSSGSSDSFNKVGLTQTSTMTTGSPAYLQTPTRWQAPPKYAELFVPPPYEEANNLPSTSN